MSADKHQPPPILMYLQTFLNHLHIKQDTFLSTYHVPQNLQNISVNHCPLSFKFVTSNQIHNLPPSQM